MRAYGGTEVDTQGDAFFLAFPRAPDALAAAGLSLTAGRTIRVRIGVHTGTPLLTEEGYVGGGCAPRGSHRGGGARRSGARLVATSGLARGRALRDLGEHRFKDLLPRASVPAGRRRVPAAEVAVPHEPAGTGHAVSRPRARARESSRLARRRAARVADRPRRDRQDATCVAGRGGGIRRVSRTGSCGFRWRRRIRLVLPRRCAGGRRERELGRSCGGLRRLAGKRAARVRGQPRASAAGRRDARSHASRVAACPTFVVTSRERFRFRASRSIRCRRLSDDGVAVPRAARALDSDVERLGRSRRLCARLDNLPLALELAAARTPFLRPAAPRAAVAAARPAQGGPRRRSAPADAACDDRVVPRPARRTSSGFSAGCPSSRADAR